MFLPEPFETPDQSLMQDVLEPLLEDFQYWFSEAKALLDSPKASCLVIEQRQTLIEQISAAQQEVSAVSTLLKATGGQAGVDMPVVMHWHQLVGQCWQVSRQIRLADQAS